MAGSLILIDQEEITTAVSSVTLTGITTDYDVYRLIVNGYEHDSAQSLVLRVTNSGSARTGTNYEYAYDYLKRDTTDSQSVDTASSYLYITTTVGTGSADYGNADVWLFNFPNSSEYSQYNVDSTFASSSQIAYSLQGSGAYMVAESNDGVHLFGNNNYNFTGNFRLYALKK